MTPQERRIIQDHQAVAPVDITAMATDLGLSVYDDEPLELGVSGRICRDVSGESPSGYRIDVNPRDAYRRQRFTVAHECAHYLLHREKIGDGLSDNAMYRSEKMTNAEEFEANNLAAELIMPRSLILAHYRNGQQTFSQMADLFDVSEQAMRVRLRYLLYIR
jgi:hypothetical protein